MAAAPFKVKAIFEYTSVHEDDLPFSIGQVITVTDVDDADWYGGEYVDDSGTKHEGIFPRNFVEKYEPTAPPRPTRTRAKKEAETPAPEPADSEPQDEPEVEEEAQPAVTSPAPPPAAPAEPEPVQAKAASPPALSAPIRTKPAEPAAAPPSASKPSSPPTKSSEAPETSGKPSSFKDRIAAFNKPAAPPIAPFKPSGLSTGGGGFIKKPFVAPPPSRNAFVPPPREAPTTKVYRREEDPEIKETEAEAQEAATKAGFGSAGSAEEGGEDQPKPTSLKERIALLQKQQQEAAQRHAEAAAKKEKPKKPHKKHTGSSGHHDAPAMEESPVAPPTLERRDTEETGGKRSMDEQRAPPPPSRRKSSKGAPAEPIRDGNEADMSGAGDTTEGQEDLTEKDDSDVPRSRPPQPPPRAAAAPVAERDEEEDDEEEEEGQEEDDDDVDPEVRRKEELRARMAKMSGGMGMPGMFGMMPMPSSAPPKKKKSSHSEERTHVQEDEEEPASATRGAPPVPMMMALPGIAQQEHERPRQPPPPPARPSETQDDDEEDEEEEEEEEPETPHEMSRRPTSEVPPVPGSRPVPPPIPTEMRSPPPPPPADLKSPRSGSESDDELSERAHARAADEAGDSAPPMRSPPPPPPGLASPKMPSSSRSPTFPPPGDEGMPTSPTSATSGTQSKRSSRLPPPIPGSVPAPPSSSRPPPPPPPAGSLSRRSTSDVRVTSPIRPTHSADDEEEEVTEYEGDYDTDIASSVPHKDALKSHARESSFEDNTPVVSPSTEAPPSLPPPIPSGTPRGPPPPLPSQPPPAAEKRRSVDAPRGAPPPPPPPKETTTPRIEPDHDGFNYGAPKGPVSAGGYAKSTPRIEEEEYFPDVGRQPGPSHGVRPPPPAPPSTRAPPRQSLDAYGSPSAARRSADMPRQSSDAGFIAEEIDLAVQSGWWRQPNQVPPVLQGRRDVYFESQESTTTNRGTKTVVTREIHVLFQDYSQTIITVRFDPYDMSDADVAQRHEPPPRVPRQDQLEQAYERFGMPISEAVNARKDSVVADGSPFGLVHDLLRPYKDALAPVGTRAFGALVYSNMANASTQQHDEIRRGDILSIRNARFQGKHGAMHAKYSMEVGKPDHVAVVAEWDGTKKKVRAWEQGRESKKVKMESFKLDDLRSGEVKIWRIMPRSWVGWNVQS